MFSENNRISNRQLQALLILDVFGTGIAALPSITARFALQNGWICVIVGTFIALIFILLMNVIASRYAHLTFPEYTAKIIGKPLAVVLSGVFVFKIIVTTALELRFFGEIVRQALLFDTPFFVICAALLLIAGFTASKGYETRARLAELLIVAMLVPLLLVFAVSATQADYSNLLPIGHVSMDGLFAGGYQTAFAFTGFEFTLLAYPYLRNPKATTKRVMQAGAATGIFMAIITAITIARFGGASTARLIWPVIDMMDTINLPGSVLERQGALVMSFWIISVFSIVSAGLFFSSLLLRDITRRGKHTLYIVIVMGLIFIATTLPRNVAMAFEWLWLINSTLGLFYLLILPALLLLISSLRGHRA